MKTVGEVLKKEREKQHKTLLEISKATCISVQYLQALEENNFYVLPSPVSAQGFLTSYAEELHIPTATILALLRRDFEMKDRTIVPVTTISVIPKHRQQKHILLAVAVFLTMLGVFVGYGVWSYQRLRQPPSLTITAPQDGSTVRSPVIVRGNTLSDAVVQIDTQPVAVSQDGEFVFEEDLLGGTHTITIVAKNRQGAQSIKQITLQVEE